MPEQAGNLMALLEHRGIGRVGVVRRAGGRLRGADRDRGPVPGAARAVPGQGGSIRPIRTAWCAPDFVDRRTADQRTPGNRQGGGRETLMTDDTSTGQSDRSRFRTDRRPGHRCGDRAGAGGRRTRRGARGAAAGGRHPGDGGCAGRGDRSAGLPGGGQAAADGRGTRRPRQRHRPARGRRGLADVHPGAVRAVRGAAAARRRPLEADPRRAGDAGGGRLPAAGDPGAGERGARGQRRRGDADAAGARTDHRGGHRSRLRRGDVRDHRAVPGAARTDVADRSARHRAAAARRRRHRRPQRNPG